MNNLKLLENGLIPVYENEKCKAVNARELHNFLEVGKDFTTWIKDRVEKYGFIENEDFIVFTENGENLTGGRPKTEYILTMDTAKEIAMVQNNEKGSQARKYFIAIEKKYKEISKPACIEDLIIMQAQSLKDLRKQLNEVNHHALEAKAKVEETKEEVQAIRDVVEIRPSDRWRKDTNLIMSKVCKKLNDYKLPKEEVYKAVNERARVDLKRRLENMRGRLALEGATKTKIDNLNYLDVIAADKKLIEIYTAIVKEMAIKYKVA